jgi:hypothetical protein
MPGYQVKFFKHLINCSGRPFKCLQRMVDVDQSRTAAEAIECAQRRFEQLEHVSDWKLRADTVECECLPGR